MHSPGVTSLPSRLGSDRFIRRAGLFPLAQSSPRLKYLEFALNALPHNTSNGQRKRVNDLGNRRLGANTTPALVIPEELGPNLCDLIQRADDGSLS
jgi:hypothetical protein